MHSIFQISISRNTICTEMVNFRKPGHILLVPKEALIGEHNLKPLLTGHKESIDW